MVLRRGVLISSIVVALSACGGGGDSKSGNAEVEKPAAASERGTPDEPVRAVLTAENAEAFLAGFEAFTSTFQGLYDPYAGSLEPEAAEVSAMAGVQIEPAVSEEEAEDGGLLLLESGDYACPEAGSITVSQEEDSSGMTYIESYRACSWDGAILEGTLGHRFEDFRGAGTVPGYVEFAFDPLHLTGGQGFDLVFEGKLAFKVSSDGATKFILFDGSILDNHSERVYLAQNLVVEMPSTAWFGPELGYRYRVSGAYGDSEFGNVALSNEPSGKAIVIKGENHSKIRMSVVPSINQRVIAVDADGDSSYESQWYLPW